MSHDGSVATFRPMHITRRLRDGIPPYISCEESATASRPCISHSFAQAIYPVSPFFVSPELRSCNMAQEFTRWYVHSCPLASECSKTAWDRQKYCESLVSGETTRANLLRHFMASSLHNHNSSETLNEEAGLAFVEEERVAGHWWATKKAKEIEAAEHAAESHESAGRPSNLLRKPSSPPPRVLTRRSKETIHHDSSSRHDQDSKEDHIIDVATKAAVPAATAMMLEGRPARASSKRSAMRDESSSHKIRKIDDLINAVQRASSAAGKAAHICEQARIAFESEKNNLDAALEDIERTA